MKKEFPGAGSMVGKSGEDRGLGREKEGRHSGVGKGYVEGIMNLRRNERGGERKVS